MKVGDLVHFGSDKTVGVVVEIKENSDCRVLFGGQIYLCVQHSLEVINASR